MRELESLSDEPAVRQNFVLHNTGNTNIHASTLSAPSSITDHEVDMDAAASTSSNVVPNSPQSILGSPNKDGGSKRLLNTFMDRNLLIKQCLRVESFDESVPTNTKTSSNPDSGKKRPRVVSGDAHNRTISWADIVENKSDNADQLNTESALDFEDSNGSSRGDKDVRKYLSPHVMPFYSDARNCLIKQGRQEIRNDFYRKCIDENIVIHELTITQSFPRVSHSTPMKRPAGLRKELILKLS